MINSNKEERIQKLISNYGNYSRREVEKLIVLKKVYKNNELVSLGDRAKLTDKIVIDGNKVNFTTKHDYFLVNKPKGYISKRVDAQHKEVISLVDNPKKRNIFTVGRLDVLTTGLIIVTSDGELSEIVNSPYSRIKKTYLVWCKDELTPTQMATLKRGVKLDDGYTTKPLKYLKAIKVAPTMNTYKIKIIEGKRNQIRRMWTAVNSEAINLKRVEIGSLTIDQIPSGGYKRLSQEEIYKKLGINKKL